MSKPYIEVLNIEIANSDQPDTLEVTFQVNGCIEIDSVKVTLSNEIHSHTETLATSGSCNYNLPSPNNQSKFHILVQKDEQVDIEVIVD